MRLHKRIVSYLLIIVIMMTNSTILAESGTDERHSKRGKAISLVSALKIMGSLSDGTFKPEDAVTRAEFTDTMVKMMGMEINEDGLEPLNYSDIPTGYWAEKSIAMAQRMNLIKGYADGTFKPDDTITYEEAVKIVVYALGYEVLANQFGGYPTGYLAVATDKNITKNISVNLGEPLRRGDLALMVSNALEVDLLSRNSYGQAAGFGVTAGKTLMTEKLNIYKKTGQVLATNETYLSDEILLGEEEIQIDTEIYKIGTTQAAQYLGYKVTYYYRQEKNSSEKVLVWIEPDISKNDMITILAEDILRFTDNKVTYMTDENSSEAKSAKISKTADIVYNGKPISYSDLMSKVPTAGKLVLINDHKDTDYNIVIITSWENYVVQSVNTQDHIIVDKNNMNNHINYNSNDNQIKFKLMDIDGKPVLVNQLKEWDVLTVAKSRDGKVIKAILTRSTIIGTISEIGNNDHGRKTVVIDGKKYEYSSSYSDPAQKPSRIGDNVVLYLDFEGKIAAIDIQSGSNMKYAYLKNASIYSKGFNKGVVFKLFTTDGNWVKLMGKEKIKLDNKSDVEPNEVYARLLDTNGKVNMQMITYKLDDNNMIEEMDLPYNPFLDSTYSNSKPNINANESWDSFRYDVNLETLKYKDNAFSGKVNMNNKTKLLCIPRIDAPDNDANDDLYRIKTPADLTVGAEYSIDAYGTKKIRGFSNCVIWFYNNAAQAPTSNTRFNIVQNVVTTVDDKGDTVQKIYGYVDGKYSETLTKEANTFSSLALKAGDIIRYEIDANGRAHNVPAPVKLFDADTKTIINDLNMGTGYTAYKTLNYGKVYARVGNIIQVVNSNVTYEQMGSNGIFTNYLSYDLSGAKILMYNSSKSNQKVSEVTADAILDYVHSGQDCSNVYMYMFESTVKMILIVK